MGRITKQIIFGLIYLAIFTALGWFVYLKFLKPKPNCFDYLQNQGEEGVDCGAICGNICLPADLRPLTVAPGTQIFYPDPSHLAVLAQITNANSTLAAPAVDYKFVLKNKNGETKTVDGQTYIYKNEIKYVTYFGDYNLSDNSNPLISAELQINQPTWVKAKDFEYQSVKIQQFYTEMDAEGVRVRGKINNESATTLRDILILALLKDQDGKTISIAKTTVDLLPPGGSEDFEIIHPVLKGVSPALTEVLAYAKQP